MSATGPISQAIVTQMNLNMSLVKKQAEVQKGLVEMIEAATDMMRGQNLDIAV